LKEMRSALLVVKHKRRDRLRDLGLEDTITFRSVIVCGPNSRDPPVNQQRSLMNTIAALEH
jgi:hypothetical protein